MSSAGRLSENTDGADAACRSGGGKDEMTSVPAPNDPFHRAENSKIRSRG